MIKRWLVSRPDGGDPRVLRAESAHDAVVTRVVDPDDPIGEGDLVGVWRLGNFPAQFQAGVRFLGNPAL